MKVRVVSSWVAIAAFGLFAFAGVAQAASIQQMADASTGPFGAATNFMSDDSQEALINRVGGASTVDVGDSLRGIIRVRTFKTPLVDYDLGGASGNNELTAIFQTLVLGKTETSPGSGVYQFVFGPDPAFGEAAALGIAASTAGGAGAIALFFEDATPDFTKSNGPLPGSADYTNATDGTFFWALGFLGDFFGGNGVWDGGTGDDTIITSNDEAWIAVASDPTPASGQIGSAYYALNRVLGASTAGSADNWVLEVLFGDSTNGYTEGEVTGTTDFYANTPAAAWPISDNAEFGFNPLLIVPVPAAAWMGFALLGLLGLGRRFRRRS